MISLFCPSVLVLWQLPKGWSFPFFSHNFFLLVQPSWKSLADFPFQDLLRLLILAIWSSSLFSTFLATLHSCYFFPNSWNLLLLGWKFSSSHFYLLFSHLWFIVVQLLCSWMFTLYFLIRHCMTGRLRPSCSSQPLWSYLGCIVHPRDPRVLAFSRIPAQFPLLGFFWLTDIGRLGISFTLWNLKPFPFMGLWTPIIWTFSSFSSFFFPFFITG